MAAIQGPIVTTSLLLLVTSALYFFSRLRSARMRFRELGKKGLPIAPHHNFFLGHLLYIKGRLDAMPKGAHFQYALCETARDYFVEEGVYYLDMWPVAPWFLVVVSPQVGIQATQTNSNLSMERPHLLRRFFKPIAGGASLFDLPEKEWKHWRPIFNKGFNPDHILSLVPGMVKETRVYASTLRDFARRNELLYLDTITLRFTIDLIGRTILNSELGAQRGYNTLADCMISQIRWHNEGDKVFPLGKLDVVRQFMYWWNGRQMDQYVRKEIDKRYDEFKQLDSMDTRRRSAIDLILQAYMDSVAGEQPQKLEAGFRAFAIRQIRLFVFAGHDSTSSTICYCIHLLSTYPEVLARLRSEHDTVFGTELSVAATMLEQQPSIVNSLPYTTAVIKEALRLFPPAASVRQGKPNEFLTDDQGNICPTENTMIEINHLAMHRAPKYWVQAEEFLPERWLVEEGHELYPVKGAWRPFEHGPRNCIAQGLVMVELRVVLTCIAREFDFKPAYDEFDFLHPPGKGPRTYNGERAYQVAEAAAHPVDHYPCRVSSRIV